MFDHKRWQHWARIQEASSEEGLWLRTNYLDWLLPSEVEFSALEVGWGVGLGRSGCLFKG